MRLLGLLRGRVRRRGLQPLLLRGLRMLCLLLVVQLLQGRQRGQRGGVGLEFLSGSGLLLGGEQGLRGKQGAQGQGGVGCEGLCACCRPGECQSPSPSMMPC